MKRLCLTLILVSAAALMAGCIRSRVVINTDPQGAEVIWRGKPYGATPITIPIVWYWYYDYAIEKPGYQRIDKLERFRTPPWFLIPTDLVMEIVPIPIHDTRELHFTLEPIKPAETVTIQ